MTLSKLPELNRPAYSLQEIAELAGISMDKLLGEHIGQGDIDLYFDISSIYKVYSFISNFLEKETFNKMVPYNVLYAESLITPKEQYKIFALRLSWRDCERLARSRKITQFMFGVGLKGDTIESSEAVFLRDWNFIPMDDMQEYKSLHCKSEEYLKAEADIRQKGATFRLHPKHIESGASDNYSHKYTGRAPYKYQFFLGLYPDGKTSLLDNQKGIFRPVPQTIFDTDVWALKEDVYAFLEKFKYPKENNATDDGKSSRKFIDGIPIELLPFFKFYSCPDKVEIKDGVVRIITPEEPAMLKALFEIREETWGCDWLEKIALQPDKINEYNNNYVKSIIIERMESMEITLTKNDINNLLFFIRPVWARREVQNKDDWYDTYETPELM